MDEKELDSFFQKFIKNQYSEGEHELFVKRLKTLPANELEFLLKKYGKYFENLPASFTEIDSNTKLSEKIEARLDALESARETKIIGFSLIKRITAAAAIIIGVVTCIYVLNKPGHELNLKANISPNFNINPGGNKAVLTLANGSTIILDNAKNGVLTSQKYAFVRKVKDGELRYDPLSAPVENKPQYNTIATPKGGQYHIILPDGSKVWLNSVTTLKFPTSFTGNTRNVELTGEAYFEVAKNKNKPFRVTLNNMQIEVLGTHFNVMSYADERSIKTTLLEGSVKVTKGGQSKIIVPGEQADVENDIKILKVNAEQAIEWKNGNFNFSNENIRSIMRKVSRWYNVDIEYQGEVTNEGFVGIIPRAENISEVLNVLELTGLVHFKIKEGRIIVMR